MTWGLLRPLTIPQIISKGIANKDITRNRSIFTGIVTGSFSLLIKSMSIIRLRRKYRRIKDDI